MKSIIIIMVAGSVVGNVLYGLAGLMHSQLAILASRTMIGGWNKLEPNWNSQGGLQKEKTKSNGSFLANPCSLFSRQLGLFVLVTWPKWAAHQVFANVNCQGPSTSLGRWASRNGPRWGRWINGEVFSRLGAKKTNGSEQNPLKTLGLKKRLCFLVNLVPTTSDVSEIFQNVLKSCRFPGDVSLLHHVRCGLLWCSFDRLAVGDLCEGVAHRRFGDLGDFWEATTWDP